MRPIFVFLQNRPHFGAQILHVNSLHALRERFPGRRITIIGKYPASKVCLELGLADEWQAHKKVAVWRKAILERPAYVVSFGPKNLFPIILARLLGAKLVAYRNSYLSFLLSAKVDYDDNQYRGINYRRLLQAHAIEPVDYPAEPEDGIHDQIIFMPGGTGGREGSFEGHKKWGMDRFYDLFLRLRRDYPQYRYTFVLGPLERTEHEWLQSQTERPDIEMEASIDRLFARVRRARLVIANDCGPAHIAHILRKDMVQLFLGPNPEWFLPRAGAIELHGEHGDIETIPLDEVHAAAQRLLRTTEVEEQYIAASESYGG